MAAKITFYGGAGTVTGANFHLDTGAEKILVDCGVLQREHVCDPVNFAPFAYDVKAVSTLIVTHAHADHIGRIPKLVREGFGGVIYSTGATKELASLMLNDALGVMQSDAERNGCDVLYEKEDVARALSLWHTHEYHEPFAIGDTTVEFSDAGHILGSAMVRLTRDGKAILFTGDLGNTPEPLLNDMESSKGAHYIVMESVYGDRVHPDRNERREHLRGFVEDVRSRNGTLLIPSFSIERTQVLLFELNTMIEEGVMQPIPVYLDAPLAIEVTEVFRKYRELLNPNAQQHFAHGHDPFSFKGLSLTHSTGESHSIHDAPNPKVIIAGAGMSNGGRIRSHEKHYLADKHATILFVGYQAPGSLGRRIQDGEKKVQIDREHVKVRAHIATLTGYSGHADREQLLSFAEEAGESLRQVFVAMGEPQASMFLAQRIKDFLGVSSVVPHAGESFDIDW